MTDATREAADEALAARAAQGDRAAFDVLVRRHKEPLYRFARRYVGQADDAYDVLQESFVSAWLALRRYDPKRPFEPWLYRIVLNKCRDHGRRQTVRRLMLRMAAAEPTPDEVFDDSSPEPRLRKLDQAVAALPSRYKEPLLLTVIQGLSHDDAAKTLGISSKAVEMRLYRARQKLRLLMEQSADAALPADNGADADVK